MARAMRCAAFQHGIRTDSLGVGRPAGWSSPRSASLKPEPGARRRSTSSTSEGFRRSRSERIGRPSACSRAPARPRDRREAVIPGEAVLVRAVVLVGHDVEQLEGFDGQEAMRHAGRDEAPLVGRHLEGLHAWTIGALEHRPDIDERDEGEAAADDPVVRLVGDGGGARAGHPAETEAFACRNCSPGNQLDRHSSRKEPRSSACRASRPRRTPSSREPVTRAPSASPRRPRWPPARSASAGRSGSGVGASTPHAGGLEARVHDVDAIGSTSPDRPAARQDRRAHS